MTTVPAGYAMAGGDYPAGLDVDTPGPQSRLTVFFRILLAVPHLVILYFLNIALQVVSVIGWFAILFTGRYPEGLATFAASVLHWYARVTGYTYLLTGAYPPFALGPDQQYPVRFRVEPQIEGRNRLTVFFRLILAIPHLIVLSVLAIVAGVVILIAWVAALITGSVPAGLHSFLTGYTRWMMRVQAYYMLLVDEYPPFALN